MRVKSLNIENFRGFRYFQMKDLGRVNLIVGTNNCGKTTVLEAVNILTATGDASAIWSTLSRRGEDLWVERDLAPPAYLRQVEIRRLFRGHDIDVGTSFGLSGELDTTGVTMTAKVEEFRQIQPELFESELPPVESSEEFLTPLRLSLSWSRGPSRNFDLAIPISRGGGVSIEAFRRASRAVAPNAFPLRFVTASSLTAEPVTALFEEIVLTPEEDLVTDALRVIEPAIERIASAGSERVRPSARFPSRGIFIRLNGVKDRVPIGSMGDGIWRMLGLALNVVHSSNGILLVDEIDTGLHHTVMKEMWKFLYNTAEKYEVQVFATTHSRDCYQSLAAVCRDSVAENSDATIQRIERHREESVAYTEQEIIAAAERDTEVR
ncbi:MAG: AAA family ATPase [Isosphaeraceae bacterium]